MKSIGSDRPRKLGKSNDGNGFRNEASCTQVRGLANIQQQPPAQCDAWFDVFEYENTESEDEMFCSSEKKFELDSLNKKMYRPSHVGLESDDEDNDMFSSPNPRLDNSCSRSDKSSQINTNKPDFANNLSSKIRIRNTLSHKTLSQKPFDESKVSVNHLGKDEKDENGVLRKRPWALRGDQKGYVVDKTHPNTDAEVKNGNTSTVNDEMTEENINARIDKPVGFMFRIVILFRRPLNY